MPVIWLKKNKAKKVRLLFTEKLYEYPVYEQHVGWYRSRFYDDRRLWYGLLEELAHDFCFIIYLGIPMEPKYQNGSRGSDSRDWIYDQAVYAVSCNNQTIYQTGLPWRWSARLVSINPKYKDIHFLREKIRGLWALS